MKINENKVIFKEVRFDDLKAGDTFVIDRGSRGYTYGIKTKTDLIPDMAFDLQNGSVLWLKPFELVIPAEITGDVKWPDKFFKQK